MTQRRWDGRGFLAAARAGEPVATWVSQNLPLTFLVPISIWLSIGSGRVLETAIAWGTGGLLFNLWWAPFLRRNEHPPVGSSQTIATATSTAGVFLNPEMGLLLVGFMLMGVALGVVSGSRLHSAIQSACALAAGYAMIGSEALTMRSFVIFAVLIFPMAFASISFVVAALGHREGLLDMALAASGGTAWDTRGGVVHSSLGVGISGVTVGSRLSDLVHPDDHRPANPEPGSTLEYRVPDGDGGWRWLRENIDTAASNRDEQRSGVRDITTAKLVQERDHERANLDQLTGQPNRANHIRTSARWARRAKGSLLLFDLDDFKQINDTLGHSTGDQVLREVANRLASVDRIEHAARLGGDEFACLVDGDAMHAYDVAIESIASLIEPFSIESMAVYSGACVGVAPFEPGIGADEIRRRAGVALREAKTSGGTALVYDEVLEEQSARTKSLAIDLPTALRGGDIVVHYQPKLDLLTQRVIGYEALVRWQHPNFGLLTPGDFLDLVSVSGLHRELYQVVLEQALADLTRLRGDASVKNVSVNVHARNLREPDLVSRTLSMLEMHGLSPRDLILELTEEALIAEDPAVAQTLLDLDEAGLVLSADDFGSGFSSLSYLNRLPVREMKLDRSLVSQVVDSPRAQAVVESVLGLASRLGLTVVAEGIEDEKTLDYLVEEGCPQGQGYLIGKPQSADYWVAESQPNYRAMSA